MNSFPRGEFERYVRETKEAITTDRVSVAGLRKLNFAALLSVRANGLMSAQAIDMLETGT